jgi:hypothetical protein
MVPDSYLEKHHAIVLNSVELDHSGDVHVMQEGRKILRAEYP